MGSNKNVWCCFQQGYKHDTERCYTLAREIEELIKRGLLQIFKARTKEEVLDSEKGDSLRKVRENKEGGERRKRPIMGYLNTIAGGFLGGGCLVLVERGMLER